MGWGNALNLIQNKRNQNPFNLAPPSLFHSMQVHPVLPFWCQPSSETRRASRAALELKRLRVDWEAAKADYRENGLSRLPKSSRARNYWCDMWTEELGFVGLKMKEILVSYYGSHSFLDLEHNRDYRRFRAPLNWYTQHERHLRNVADVDYPAIMDNFIQMIDFMFERLENPKVTQFKDPRSNPAA